ncbi:SMP-30/gluconolactonase/LRE family protein (plasmid) [Mycolicibacterium psychrotolerans]|uniref:SMP-30/gluconolactonase/LRE family protein n=1 Tax=Mycolicibacterium psychrotolerans TaxID=216929 RepID=UPI003D67D464
MVLTRTRPTAPDDECMAYWRGPHAQAAAHVHGVADYRMHYLRSPSHGIGLPADGAAATPPQEPIAAIAEMVFAHPLALLAVARHHAQVSAHGRAVIERRQALITGVHARWEHPGAAGIATGFRAVVMLRRRAGVDHQRAASALSTGLGEALWSTPAVTEVRIHLIKAAPTWVANTCCDDFDRGEDRDVHASVIVSARDESALRRSLNSAAVSRLHPELSAMFDTIHTYPVDATDILRRDNRPAVPGIGPVPKPRLEPRRRTVRPAPPNKVPQTLPPGRLIAVPGGPPEDVIAEVDGSLLCSALNGAIVRVNPTAGTCQVVANTGGRPLGLELTGDGSLLVCDAQKGLLRIDMDSADIEPLVQRIDGVALRYCSNAAAQSDGTIWFTESTNRFDLDHYVGALLEHRPSGRLFRRDPDGTVETVLSDLYFVNGVALTPGEEALFYTETGGYSVTRLDLAGPQAGRRRTVVENLPGFPDNLSGFAEGKAWFALTNPRNAMLDGLATSPPWVRKALWRIPDALTPQPKAVIHAMAIDPAGAVVDEIRGVRDDFDTATGVVEVGDHLYLASVKHPYILDLDRSGAQPLAQHPDA